MQNIQICGTQKWSIHVSDRWLHMRYTHTHTHPFNGPFARTTRVSRYQKGKTNLDFTEARDSEWQWHRLGHMQVCTSLKTDNHASTPQLSFFYRPDALPAAQPTASKTYEIHRCKKLPHFSAQHYSLSTLLCNEDEQNVLWEQWQFHVKSGTKTKNNLTYLQSVFW